MKEKEERQDLSKIPGVPGVDYPIYHSVPHTNFDCGHVPAVPGMYANVETGCQVNAANIFTAYIYIYQQIGFLKWHLKNHSQNFLQAYHVCHDGREGPQGASFLCTNGTIFNQKEFACDWWYNVNCHEAPQFYRFEWIFLKEMHLGPILRCN